MANTDDRESTRRDPFGRYVAPLIKNRPAVVILALATVAVIGYLDRLTGTQLSVTALYLIPVAVVAWYVGPTGGRIAALVAGATQVAADLLDFHAPPPTVVIVWNAATIILISMVVGEVLTRLHVAFDAEHDLARTDALTGLPNTRSFDEFATIELERSRRYKRTFTLACLDLDHFKEVNDSMGHSVGDQLIRDVGKTLRANLRRVDVVARLGGDEFTLLMPETDAGQAQIALSHVRRALADLTEDYGSVVKASIGSVTFTTAPETVGDMIRLADTAMYRAKASGRDRIEAITLPDEATRLQDFELTALHEFMMDAQLGGDGAPQSAR